MIFSKSCCHGCISLMVNPLSRWFTREKIPDSGPSAESRGTDDLSARLDHGGSAACLPPEPVPPPLPWLPGRDPEQQSDGHRCLSIFGAMTNTSLGHSAP